MADPFFDSNVVLYLVSADKLRAERAEDLLSDGGVVSVQVLNEIVNVARNKYEIEWGRIRTVLSTVRATCRIEPLTIATHELALEVAQRYRFSFYDCLIVAAALIADSETLYSEDLQDGQRIGSLTIRNPFAR